MNHDNVCHGTRILAHVVGFCFSALTWPSVSHYVSKLRETFQEVNFMAMQVP